MQLLKSYTITGSRCSPCWSALDKEFAQTHGNQLLPPITPICCYLSSPTFLTPVHLFYTEVLLSSRPRVYQPHGNPYTKAKPRRHETNGDTYVASWFFSPIHYPPTQWDCSGRSEWHFQTENLKLYFNTQPLCCHRNNTMRLI